MVLKKNKNFSKKNLLLAYMINKINQSSIIKNENLYKNQVTE